MEPKRPFRGNDRLCSAGTENNDVTGIRGIHDEVADEYRRIIDIAAVDTAAEFKIHRDAAIDAVRSYAIWGIALTGLGAVGGSITGVWIAQPPTVNSKFQPTNLLPIIGWSMTGAVLAAIFACYFINKKVNQEKGNA